MKSKQTILFLIILTGLMPGCRREQVYPMQTLSVSVDNIIVPSVGASYTFDVQTNTAWKVSVGSDSWISPSLLKFTGSARMKVDFSANAFSERSSYVLISSADGKLTRRIRVLQLGARADGVISVRALRSFETDYGYTFPDEPWKIKGFITSDFDHGNIISGILALEDNDNVASSGIFIESSEKFACGTEVTVNLAGARISRSADGLLTLYPRTGSIQSTGATPIDLVPCPVSLPELRTGRYEAMLVTMDNVQILEEYIGSTYGSSPVMMDTDNGRLTMKVSADAPFAEEVCPPGGGMLTGIAGRTQIWPRRSSDITLSEKRLEINALTGFPYMFSLYVSDASDNNSYKYFTVREEPYDAATMQAYKYYYDIDRPSLCLTVRMAGTTSSQVMASSTILYANRFGYDNIPAKSFVSEEFLSGTSLANKGLETYFLLSAPVAKMLPDQFTVTAGFCMYNTFSQWKVEYSKDGTNWYGFNKATQTGSGVFPKVTAQKTMVYLSARIESEIQFLEGDMFYLKISPYGNAVVPGDAASVSWNAEARLTSGIYIGSAVPGNTPAPADAIYFQPFDNLTLGVDYLYGERLGAMDNVGGPEFSEWTEVQQAGMEGEYVLSRPGYAQIGVNNSVQTTAAYTPNARPGTLTTPALNVSGNVELSFEAMAFKSHKIRKNVNAGVSDADATSIYVEVLGGGTIDGQSLVRVDGLPTAEFKSVRLSIQGATPATKICFRSVSQSESMFGRWFIDNICVTR